MNFMDNMSASDKLKMYEEPSNTSFTFGDGRSVKSNRRIVLPCHIAGIAGCIKTDVVPCNIPLLLSRAAMKKGKMKMDFDKDVATFMDKNIALATTVSGHYSLPLSL